MSACQGTKYVSGHNCVWAQTYMFLPRHDWDHTIITCQDTNVPGHKHVWAQSCLGTIVPGHNRAWAQSCLGTIVSGHNRVWAQSCLGTIVSGHKYVWAQSCGLRSQDQKHQTSTNLIHSWNSIFRFDTFSSLAKATS